MSISDDKRREVAEQLMGARPTTYYAEELVETIKDALLPAYPVETWTEPTDLLSALADLIEPSEERWRSGYDAGFASADDWYAQHTDEELAEHGLKRERTCHWRWWTMESSEFKARFVGANYHNIDGTGWPDSVVMGNGGDLFKGTYKTKEYVPYRTCHNESTGNFFCCSECGAHFWFAVPRGSRKAMSTMEFCPNCGARVVNSNEAY